MTKEISSRRRFPRPHWNVVFFIILGIAATLSCTSPAAIANFADASEKALAQGPPIFRDLHDSCLRRHLAVQPILPAYLPSGSKSSAPADVEAVCAAFAQQGDGLAKASDVLSAYFRAMQQLASFNTSTVSAPAEQAAENAATGAQLNLVQIDSIGKLAGIVTEAFTAGYRRRRLNEYLRQADQSISAVSGGFQNIAGKDYESLLVEERSALVFRYRQAGDATNSATILLLNRAYGDDLAELNRHKAAADAYVQALALIRDGHHTLAQNAGRLNTKGAGLAIQPYTEKIEALLPVIEKGF